MKKTPRFPRNRDACDCYYCAEKRKALTPQRRSDYGLGTIRGKEEGIAFARREAKPKTEEP